MKEFRKIIEDNDRKRSMIVKTKITKTNKLPYFAMTADIYKNESFNTDDRYFDRGGQLTEDIEKYFPELKKYQKWHLTALDGPMYYIENTIYHAQNGDLDYARNTAVDPKATIEQLQDKEYLLKRLPKLMKEFKKDMTELGLWKEEYTKIMNDSIKEQIKKQNINKNEENLICEENNLGM